MKSFSQLARLSHPVRVVSSVRCLKVGRLEKSKVMLKKPEAFKQAYDLFDADGDGSITPEELISILTSLGETPGDMHLYFGGMATDTITNHKQVVDFLTFLIQHINTYEPETAEETVTAQFAQYDPKGLSTITSEDLGDWIDAKAPHLSDEQIDHLVEGADIDGDGEINYRAYLALVCQRILKLNSAPLKEVYKYIDEDHDGQISPEELMKATGASSDMFEKVDFDHSGSVSFVEFLFSIFKTKDTGAIRAAFEVYDIDNSGKISSNNLRQWCLINGLPQANADALIQAFDFDADGEIDYEEFIYAVVQRKM